MKALGYTRLSQRSDLSIQNQTDHIQEYCEKEGFELVEILSDGEDASGFAPADLEAYQTLLTRVRAGEVDAVVVNAKRRLVRDENAVMRLIADIRASDTELHTYQSGQVDLSEPMSAAIEIMRAAASAEEKRKEIERSREVVRERMEDPEVDHGAPRFGMTYSEDGRRQVPGEEFDTVLEVIRLRDRGCSFPEIRDEVGVSLSTAWRVVQRREWYIERTKLEEELA